MSGNERLGDDSIGRVGDEPADYHQEGFAVYLGNPVDPQPLDTGGDTFIEDMDRYMTDTRGGYGGIGRIVSSASRTHFDDMEAETDQQ